MKRAAFEDEGGRTVKSSLKRAVFEDDGSGMRHGWECMDEGSWLGVQG